MSQTATLPVIMENWQQAALADATHRLREHRVQYFSPTGLVFMKPDNSSDDSLRYTIVEETTLLVTGDRGEAVYNFNRYLTWAELATLPFWYMLGKCSASPTGRGFLDWNADAAEERIRQLFSTLDESRRADLKENLSEYGLDTLNDRHSWNAFADMELSEYWPDLDGILDIGMVPAFDAFMHHVGLMAAMREWDNRGAKGETKRMHVTFDLEYLLAAPDEEIRGVVVRVDDKPQTAIQVRELALSLLKQGYKVLPVCDHYDEYGNCLGHEPDPKSDSE